jgi:predicted DNA-binding transcriptional regulator YafY
MNRIDRISAILIQLQTKRIVKAQEIADRFDISLRTVYRDISTLNESGIPIIGEAGVGYSLAEGYKLPPVMFTMEEATALLTAEKLVEKFTDKKTFETHQSALFKIKAILKNKEKDFIENIGDHIEVVENPNLPKRYENNQFIQDILKSIAQKTVIAIEYFANHSQEQSQRYIEPVGVYFSSGNWHLVAYCQLRQDYRNFRVDRISAVQFTNQPFQKPHLSLKTYLNQLTKQEHELQTVVMRVNKEGIRYVANQKYYMGFVSERAVKDGMEMTFLTTSTEGFARWYLMIGDMAEIISPQSIKESAKVLGDIVLKKLK